LPTSASGEIGIVQRTCELDGSGTLATASGSFTQPLAYPSDATPPPGKGFWRLRIYVNGANAHVLGFASKTVALGSTKWVIRAKVPVGAKPTQCVFTIFQTVY
jgi:hypothetical protein